MTGQGGNLPTFIGVGPGRTGTSLLYEVLLEHPEVRMAAGTKETNFFDLNYRRGVDWYRRFFRDSSGARAVGEISTTYFYDPRVPERIAAVVPEVKLHSVLREPFARLRSVYNYRRRAGTIPADMPLERALEVYPDLIADNNYADHLEGFFVHFPREQVLVQRYDDLTADPEGFATELFRFIGVNPDFRSAKLHQRVNPAARPRSRLAGTLAAGISRGLRRLNLLPLLTALKRSRLVRGVVLTETAGDEPDPLRQLTPECTRRLRDGWLTQVERLEQLLGWDLNSWKGEWNGE